MSDLRRQIATEIKTRGVAAVARELRMPRPTVLSFITGTSRPGTDVLIEQREAERKAVASK